uniref:Caenorhabditis elegans ly-6-related family-containing protein n=1 Tax=Strongyloides ratti TaxID=34506 RepID=A0A7I5TGK2_STRRB
MFICLIIILLTLNSVIGFGCYSCVSDSKYLETSLRRILGSQRDTFYWPIDGKSQMCHNEIPHFSRNHIMTTDISGQLCSGRDACITLSPNLDLNFTIRGCVKQILRYELGEEDALKKDGCYLIRSKPLFPGEPAISYVGCICSKAYCNHEAQQSIVDERMINDTKLIYELLPILPRSIGDGTSDSRQYSVPSGGYPYGNSRKLIVKTEKQKQERRQMESNKKVGNLLKSNENNISRQNDEWSNGNISFIFNKFQCIITFCAYLLYIFL